MYSLFLSFLLSYFIQEVTYHSTGFNCVVSCQRFTLFKLKCKFAFAASGMGY